MSEDYADRTLRTGRRKEPPADPCRRMAGRRGHRPTPGFAGPSLLAMILFEKFASLADAFTLLSLLVDWVLCAHVARTPATGVKLASP